jgi:RHS repeat-associated protein
MPFKHYDEAGLLLFETYDFKGNVLEKVRQVISDDEILAVFPTPDETSPDWQIQPFRVDWHPPDGITLEDHANTLLDVTEYRTSIMYDALNRIKTLQYPEDVDSERKALSPHYNHAGALEQVELNGNLYVEHIAYNARGQRTLIAYGNGVMTRYSYDPKTFRLMRLRTEGYTNPDTLIYHPTGNLLQDFAYKYDLAGNILAIHDRTPECGIPSQPDRMDRQFSYDPLYRLLEATGRECGTPPATPWDNGSRCTDINGTKGYRQNYEYDPVGNMTSLKHNGGPDGFTRNYVIVPDGNRIAEMRVGEAVCAYTYDANGNLLRENTMRNFEWDHSDQMRVYRTQIEGDEPSVHAHYLYDAGGQRVKKLVRKHGQYEATVYIDGMFEHHNIVQGSTIQENNTLHVMDDEKRIVLIRVGSPFPGDATPAVKYHRGDHLGSSNVVIDEDGNWINREEYTPYGETSFGCFAKKQYRFTGKERDEESGLYYHGARYYAPWLGRWMNTDPLGLLKPKQYLDKYSSSNLYSYSRVNPLKFTDPIGLEERNFLFRSPEPNERGFWQSVGYELEGPYGYYDVFNFGSLDQVISTLNEEMSSGETLGHLIICVHGRLTEEGWEVNMPLRDLLLPSETISSERSRAIGFGWQSDTTLEAAAEALQAELSKLHKKVTEKTLISVWACMSDNQLKTLEAISGFFGGAWTETTEYRAKMNFKWQIDRATKHPTIPKMILLAAINKTKKTRYLNYESAKKKGLIIKTRSFAIQEQVFERSRFRASEYVLPGIVIE